jgi:hypothetical protein
VESAETFDRRHLNCCHLTLPVDQNGFYPALFLCLGNSSPGEILSFCLAQENREICLKIHSGKLSKKETLICI